jgi:DNA mismatch repair ATPase MutS
MLTIDTKTLYDLGVFSPHENAPCLFATLDSCATSAGREKLRSLLHAPHSDPSRIRSAQRSLAHILDHQIHYTLGLSDTIIFGIVDYLRTNIIPVSTTSRLGVALQAGGYRHDIDKLQRGVLVVAGFVREMQRIATAAAPPPSERCELSALMESLQLLLAKKPVRTLLDQTAPSQQLSTTQTLLLDATIRTDAKQDIVQLIDSMAQLDALGALARAQRTLGLSVPEVVDEPGTIAVQGIFHPHLSHPVPNDFAPRENEHFLFLTGPNMAGKTVYMKALGLCVYLAHLGMGVPAASMRFSPFDTLISSIHNEDSVSEGHSYFYSEILRLNEIIEAITKARTSFVLIDELFKGTNITDAHHCSAQTIAALCAYNPAHHYVLSTHLADLKATLATSPGLWYRCFTAEFTNNELVFDYQLKEGISNHTIGAHILALRGKLHLLHPSAPA